MLTQEQAKQIGQSIFKHYDRQGKGVLDENDVHQMMGALYKGMGKPFSGTNEDIKQYQQSLDYDLNNRVTIQDIETMCVKYFSTATMQPAFKSRSSKKKFSKIANDRLEIARRIFKKFDTDESGHITEDEVKGLLIETYKQIGMQYTPSEEDLRAWMEMTDTNGDGLISIEEFEDMVLKSLESCGIQIYN